MRLAESLGQLFDAYRGLQMQIRQIYYDELWQARTDENHPLDRFIRESGRKRAEYYEAVLRKWKRRSGQISNSIEALLVHIGGASQSYLSCSEDPAYRKCVHVSWTKVFELTEELRKHFDSVFESERQYTDAVSLSSAGRDGLYPQDALEKPMDHGDYYLRFEAERAEKRFIETRQFHKLHQSLTLYLSHEASFSNCCVRSEVDPVSVDEIHG